MKNLIISTNGGGQIPSRNYTSLDKHLKIDNHTYYQKQVPNHIPELDVQGVKSFRNMNVDINTTYLPGTSLNGQSRLKTKRYTVINDQIKFPKSH